MEIDWNKGLDNLNKVISEQGFFAKPMFEHAVQSYVAMEKDLTLAEESGLFGVLPHKEPVATLDITRVRTIRNRLFILGYLKEDSKKVTLDSELKEAIKRFQEEADLTVDGWVGEETWKALQELVSFETPKKIDCWFRNGKPLPALNRAIMLRLHSLGITDQKPTAGDEPLEDHFREFIEIATLLEFDGIITGGKSFPEIAALLLDQDTIVEHLSRAKIPQNRSNRLKTHSFILCAAKVELWLAGYSVRPDGPDLKLFDVYRQEEGKPGQRVREIRSLSTNNKLDLKQDADIYKTLVNFFRDNEYGYMNAHRSAKTFLAFFPSFFSLVSSGIETEKQLTQSDKIALVHEFLDKEPSKIPMVWEHIKQIGARIWDGIKRVWGWLKHLVKRTVEIGKNLSRLIYTFGLQAFSIIRHAMRATADAVSYFLNPAVPGSDPNVIAMGHEMDFDFKVFINLSAAPETVVKFAEKVEQKAAIFAAMCKLLGLFLGILLRIPKSIAAGWVGLVWGLIQLIKDLDGLKEMVVEYKVLLQSYVY